MPTNQTVLFNQFKSSLHTAMTQTGMTFNPSIDCRNDLVNFYGYTREEVSNMSDNEVFSIMDQIESDENGYEEERFLPSQIAHNKCDCGGTYKVSFVDCETAYDIYYVECMTCSHETTFNYAEEWYDEDFYEVEEVTPVKEDTRSIDELDLSVRTYNCLHRAGYKTAQQIKNATIAEISRVRNLAPRSLKELEEVLNIKFI